MKEIVGSDSVSVRMGKRMVGIGRTMVVVCGILVMLMGNLALISAQAECGNAADVGVQCYRYITPSSQETSPSPGCCEALQDSDVDCICKYFDAYGGMFDREKIANVLRQCGIQIAPGSNCAMFA